MIPCIAHRIGRLDPARQRDKDGHSGDEDVNALDVLDRLDSQQGIHLGGDDGAGVGRLLEERGKEGGGVGAVGGHKKLVGRRRPRRHVLREFAHDLVRKVATVAAELEGVVAGTGGGETVF